MENKIKANIFDIAQYIINNNKVQMGNLKLQKIVFYSYVHYLVNSQNKDTLFDDDMAEAWTYGPVFPNLYQALKKFKNNMVDIVPNKSEVPLTPEQKKSVDYTLKEYGEMHGWDLTSKTHSETPWLEAYRLRTYSEEKQIYQNKIIEKQAIYNYYAKEQV